MTFITSEISSLALLIGRATFYSLVKFFPSPSLLKPELKFEIAELQSNGLGLLFLDEIR